MSSEFDTDTDPFPMRIRGQSRGKPGYLPGRALPPERCVLLRPDGVFERMPDGMNLDNRRLLLRRFAAQIRNSARLRAAPVPTTTRRAAPRIVVWKSMMPMMA
jgi:hypothetical protein